MSPSILRLAAMFSSMAVRKLHVLLLSGTICKNGMPGCTMSTMDMQRNLVMISTQQRVEAIIRLGVTTCSLSLLFQQLM